MMCPTWCQPKLSTNFPHEITFKYDYLKQRGIKSHNMSLFFKGR